MTEHELKRLLYSYPGIMKQIETLNDEVCTYQKMRDGNISIPTSKIDGMPGGGRISDPTYENVLKLSKDYDQKVTEKTAKIEELMETQRLIDRMMYWLSITATHEHDIIEFRYFKKFGWMKISRKMNYSESWLWAMQRRVLEKCVKWWNT